MLQILADERAITVAGELGKHNDVCMFRLCQTHRACEGVVLAKQICPENAHMPLRQRGVRSRKRFARAVCTKCGEH